MVFWRTSLASDTVTYVYVQPHEQTIDTLGESFTVNINVKYALDLCGYEFKLYYNSTILNGTEVAEGQFLKQRGQTFFWVVKFDDHYNLTHGILWVDSCLLGGTFGADGEGTLVTVTFKSLRLGRSLISLDSVELVDSRNKSIRCQVVNGVVEVVPEFTILQILISLVIVAIYLWLIKTRKLRIIINNEAERL
jgi:nitrogen fixation-related uncharacterized protein